MTQPNCVGFVHPGMFLKSPPTLPSRRHRHVAAEQDSRDEQLADLLLRIDYLVDQLSQHEAALRVPDQDHAAAVVVLAEVGLPGGEDVVVGDLCGVGRDRAAAEQRLERDLPVHRREHAAVEAVAGGLIEGDRTLLGIDREIGVDALVVADRRVDVEAVELLPVRVGLGVVVPRIWPLGETSVVSKPGSHGLSGMPGLQSHVVVSLTFFGFFARAAGAARAAERQARARRTAGSCAASRSSPPCVQRAYTSMRHPVNVLSQRFLPLSVRRTIRAIVAPSTRR